MQIFQADKTYALTENPPNKKIAREIEAGGAKAILFPMVETAACEIDSQTEELINNLQNFDWLILHDIYAVDYFLQLLEKSETDFFELDNLRVCAFGETVADRLRYAQLHADVISNSVKNETVWQALTEYENVVSDLNFLIPRRDKANLEIVEKLRRAEARVVEFVVYKSVCAEAEKLPKLKAFLKGGAIDEVIFSSPEDVVNFALLFDIEDFSSLLADTFVTTENVAAFNALREYGAQKVLLRR